MKKTLITLAAILIVLAVTLYVARPFIIDRALAQRAKKIGDRFDTELLKDDHMHVVMVGTGSPASDPFRVQSCTAVIADGAFLIFDAGSGSAVRAELEALPMADLEVLFLTHLHSDHMADVPMMANNSWRAGRKKNMQVYGPTGTEVVIAGFNQAHDMDLRFRYADTPEFAPVEVAKMIGHDVPSPGPEEKILVYESPRGLKVYAFLVDHAPVTPAFGYRIEHRGRVIVISGDTKKCENIARHSRGADLLIHEAFNKALVDRMLAVMTVPVDNPGARLIEIQGRRVQHYHTSPVEAAELAQRADVTTLVYTHIIPPLGPPPVRFLVTGRFFMQGVGDAFNGEVVIAEDGSRFSLALD